MSLLETHGPLKITNMISKFIGILVPLIVPPIHIFVLYIFWQQYNYKVDRQSCSCSCWDTVFKGPYEISVGSYKHMYFNATQNATKMWIITVLAVLMLYETTKYLISAVFRRRLRFTMLILFIGATFSHYYTWWMYINYWNDEFYSQWWHQLFFSITELISTILVLRMADSRYLASPMEALTISSIALLHILAGSWDQFVFNVIQGHGENHQVIRDLAFMIPDILHVVLPLWIVGWRKVLLTEADSKKRIFRLTYTLSVVFIGLFISSNL